MLEISGITIPQQLKVDLEKYASGINTNESEIYMKFLNKHRSESTYVDKPKLKILYDLSPITENGIITYKNPGDKEDFNNKFQELFDNIFDKMDRQYNQFAKTPASKRAPRIFLKFIYDFIIGYTLTYKSPENNGPVPIVNDVRYYYNNYFMHYIGKTAKKLLKDRGLKTADEIIESLIRYGNGEHIPFLERVGGGEDYSDEEEIISQIDLDLIE
jgi:hypothetical protein